MASNAKAPDKARSRPDASREAENPKTSPNPASNQIKDPEEWVTGHEPMTGAQASYLKTLSEQVQDPEAYDPQLDKAEASKRIDQLKKQAGS